MKKQTIETNPLFAHDKVLQEVWRNRDEISAESGHDVHTLFASLRRAAKERRRKVEDESLASR